MIHKGRSQSLTTRRCAFPNPRDATHTPSATQIGRCAENAVARFLISNQYQLLGQNIRVGHLEIDIVARKGPLIAIVEVRHRGRSSWESALESINAAKQIRLRSATEHLWTTRFVHDKSVSHIRIDVAVVTFDNDPPSIEYFEGAIDWN